MAIEQVNISLSPQMAKFIRGEVKKGEHTNSSKVVRDALRRMQEAEAAKKEQAALADFEAGLSKTEREGIRRGIAHGISDIEDGRYEEYGADGLKGPAKELVAKSVKKLSGRPKP